MLAHDGFFSRSSVNFAQIVCRFRLERSSRDRVSISPRSCVNFARCSIGVRLRFEKSSSRWRIIGREEIKEIEEDSMRPKVKGSKNDACSRPRQNPVNRPVDRRCSRSSAQSTGVHDVHNHGPVDQRSTETDMSQLSFGPDRPGRSTGGQGSVDRSTSVDRQTHFCSPF